MAQKTLQDYLFESILSKFSKRSEAVDAIAKMFGLGKDAIYRRIRGDTLLTPDEVSHLARAFNVSLDAFAFENNSTVFFNYSPFVQKITSYSDYLQGIHGDLERVAKMPNSKIYYASAEIPLFHYCFFPELIGFKLYVWGRVVWDFEYLRERPFDFDLMTYPVITLTESLLKLYRDIPSIELWSLNITDFTLSQIEYHVISGGFRNPEDALIICDKVMELVNHMQIMAKNGKKSLLNLKSDQSSGASFDLFHNEMVYTNNTIVVSTDAGKAVYTAFGNPNFLKSTDPKMCDFTENWLLKMTGKSIPLSAHAEKTRGWFFNALKRKVEQARKRIESQIVGA